MSQLVDYNLDACLDYNPQPSFTKNDIAEVLAVVEGEGDGNPWHWILRLQNGAFVYLIGSCDYTGWDCQSGADSSIFAIVEEAVMAAADGDSPHTKLAAQIDSGERVPTWDDTINMPNF